MKAKLMVGFMMIVFAALSLSLTGCSTVRSYDEMPKATISYTGDIPAAGELVYVHRFFESSLDGVIRCDVTWSYYRLKDKSNHTCSSVGGKFVGLNGTGLFATVNGMETGIAWVEAK
jgi:hypothetical protein